MKRFIKEANETKDIVNHSECLSSMKILFKKAVKIINDAISKFYYNCDFEEDCFI